MSVPNYQEQNTELRKRIAMLERVVSDKSIEPELTCHGFTPKEMQFYRYLKATENGVSKHDLADLIAPNPMALEALKYVEVYICKLRQKMPDDEIIVTIRGWGYRFARIDVQ